MARKPPKGKSLAEVNPELAKEWHSTRNGDLTPKDVGIGSNKRVWWKCNKGKDHEWQAQIKLRTNRGDGCQKCNLFISSKEEHTIRFELKLFFDNIDSKEFRTEVKSSKGRKWSIDIYIPEFRVGIEYDGSYWHRDKVDIDRRKTIDLINADYYIIRIREHSEQIKLEKIRDNDIISLKPFNGKEIANSVLKQIMKMYELDAKKIAKIESYIAKKELQNEKSLDKYIDMIQTEKAEKKK